MHGIENKMNNSEMIDESEKLEVQKEKQTEEGKLKKNEEVKTYHIPVPFP